MAPSEKNNGPKSITFVTDVTFVETGFKPVSTVNIDDTGHPFVKPKFRGKYRIESARLKNYDYASDGAYFITICTKNREHFFGKIIEKKLQESEQSKICKTCWLDLPNHYGNCVLDAFVIMPNHIHGIIFIKNVETGFKYVSTEKIKTNAHQKRHSISEIIRGFKTFAARKINDFQKTQGTPFWQSRFHDHIIRGEEELNRIRVYIQNNPINWEKDRNNAVGFSDSSGVNGDESVCVPVETGFKPVSTGTMVKNYGGRFSQKFNTSTILAPLGKVDSSLWISI